MCDENRALVQTPEDMTVIGNLWGYKRGITVLSENTNLHFSRSVLPMLEGEVHEGVNLFACAVFAGDNSPRNATVLVEIPKLTYENGRVSIAYEGGRFLELDFNL